MRREAKITQHTDSIPFGPTLELDRFSVVAHLVSAVIEMSMASAADNPCFRPS